MSSKAERDFNRACDRLGVPTVRQITGIESLYWDIRIWINHHVLRRPSRPLSSLREER